MPTTGTRGGGDTPSCPGSRMSLWVGRAADVDVGLLLLGLAGRNFDVGSSRISASRSVQGVCPRPKDPGRMRRRLRRAR
jgi:hypothetical protein